MVDPDQPDTQHGDSDMSELLPLTNFCGVSLTRLIIGGNPFSGNSHVNHDLDEQMRDYYSAENIKKALWRCADCGINAVQLRADQHIMRILRDFRNEGGRLNWIAQTASEMANFQGNIRQIATEPLAAAIYHHGSSTDNFYLAGQQDKLRERLKIMRASGLPVGLGTHKPEVIAQSEDENWDVDFYMASVFDLARKERISSAITGLANTNENFYPEDIPIMYKTIGQIRKPAFIFKIMGASRRCATSQDIHQNFQEAFLNIKESDCVIVGVFQRDKDQIQENSQIVRQILAGES